MAEGLGARARFALALTVMLASGVAALGLQIVWTQQAALWLGHETAGVLAVVAAFFGGLAAGAAALGARIERSAQPQRWYAACEAVIAAWALVLTLLMPQAARALLTATGAQPTAPWQWAVAFCGTFVLLLPATAAMGATLPAMERVFAGLRREGRSVAALYAGNTLGAVVGVLAAAFWIVPAIGLSRTAWLCAAINVLCAIAAWQLGDARAASVAPVAPAAPPRGWPLLLAATGCLGIGYEVVVVRVISQVAENTVYTFAMLLAAYLVGTALGAAGYQRWLAGHADGDRLRDRLLWALAGACLLGAASLWGAEALKAAALQSLGSSFGAALAAEAVLALVAFLPATVVMGALFSHLCVQALHCGIGVGRALAVNTLGAAMAPPLFGVVLVPAVGPMFALLLVALGYLLLTSVAGRRRPWPWLATACAAAVAAFAPPLRFIDVPEGGRLVSYHEGAMAAVSVVEDADGVARLRINNRQQEGSSHTRLADARQALLPLLLHPAPRQALFLGLGTGVTALSAAQDAELNVTAVELLPEVISASQHFTQAFDDLAAAARLRVTASDARRFVRASTQRYDLIVSDNFHPARSGSGSLYTVEHFEAVRDRLEADGLFCQWLPLHQLDLDTLRSIVASFLAVYPNGAALLATNSLETPVLGLVARRDGQRWRPAPVRERLLDARLALQPAEFGLADEWALLGSFVAGPASLAAFSAGAIANTDDRPIVAHTAPRITYMADSLPRDRLLALLRRTQVTADEVVDDAGEEEWSPRLESYWRARHRFLDVGRHARPSDDVTRMLAQVQQPLLEVLRLSPDFAPAYDPLLSMAVALSRTDAPAARTLLQQLVDLQPARPEARRALAQLGG